MDTIDEGEIEEAIKRSGYLLENRILSKFLERDFWSEANHSIFIDCNENKYREIDVIATKSIDTIVIRGLESYYLYSHFIVECINNPQPLVLFENLGDIDEPSSDWIYNLTNGKEETKEIISLLIPNVIHDYETKFDNGMPSKQYCSFVKKKGDHKNDLWMAYHPDDFHKTLSKLVDCVKFKIKELHDRWEGIRPQMGRLDIFIPVVILQNDLIKIIQKSKIEIQKPKYYRLKTPYDEIYNRNMSIDIVQEKYFDDYLNSKLDGLIKISRQLKTDIIKSA